MKYILLISHGGFAEGIHSALEMFVGPERTDIFSVGLANGTSVGEFEDKLENLVEKFNNDDEIIVLGDIIGGSPLTTAIKVLDKKELLGNSILFGGMNLPLVINAVLMKDSVNLKGLKDLIVNEAKESIKVLNLAAESSDEDI